jgi:DNA polymerase III subunit delta'
MQSIIILGSIEQSREKALEIIKQNDVSKFDAQTFTSEKTIGIPDIRNLQKNIFLKPLHSDKKVVILECFLGATIDAQNAFLKVLEEPPTDTIILILTTGLDFILPTVLSRCNLINLSKKKELEEKDNKIYLELLESLIKRHENPLLIAQTYGKDRETALKFLENLIITVEENLNERPVFGKFIKKLQETYTIIKTTNVNVRFALENLLLSI